MNPKKVVADPVEGWADALAASASVLRFGDRTATAASLFAQGRAGWRAHRGHRLPALLGIADMDMLSLQLAAIVDRRPVLFCASDTAPPAPCDAYIAADAAGRNADAPRKIAPPYTGSEECPDGFAVLSSGTLGVPKTIWHRHRSLVETGAMVMRRLELTAADRILITVPLHHMYGLGAALIPALLAGARIHLLPKANLLGFNDALRAFEPTIVFSTPHLLRALLQRKSEPLKSCRGVVLAGDGIPPTLHAQARQVFNRVFDLYGSSELGVVAISEPDLPQRLLPLEGVRAFPADRDGGRGNLMVAHPHAATHIVDRGKRFAMPSEWDTRDIAIFDGDAAFAIQGRVDHSLNRAGKLLVLAELERTVMSWPGVELAVAIVLDDETAAGKTIAMVIEPSTATLTMDALKRFASETLPVFARPDRYSLVSDLPCLASGKPDRNAIAKDYRHHQGPCHG